jgi:hypothetical protein
LVKLSVRVVWKPVCAVYVILFDPLAEPVIKNTHLPINSGGTPFKVAGLVQAGNLFS